MYRVESGRSFDMDRIMELMAQTYWAASRSREVMRRAMENSVCFGAYDETGRLVAFARVVTDFATHWYLCDVIVDSSCRGMGIGKQLISTITEDARFADIPALLKTRDANGLYTRYGFQNADPGRVMYRSPK